MSTSNLTLRPHEPLSPEGFAAVRRAPGFRAAVEAYCLASLDRYQALTTIERWLLSDMGRASLSGTVLVLDALDRLTPGALLAAPAVTRGEVSRGRARLYLQRAVANGLIVPVAPGDRLDRDSALKPTARFHQVMAGGLGLTVRSAAALAPEAAPALERMSQPEFLRRVAAQLGRIIAARPELYPLDSPVQFFLSRDGGARLLEELVVRQPPGRPRFLEACAFSNSALARGSRCSRIQVIRLLGDGEAMGYLRREGRSLVVAPELSEDAERYFSSLFATTGAAVTQALFED